MKKLHLTGFTPGSDGLVLSPRKGAKSGGYVLALDDALVSAIELARRQRDGDTGPVGRPVTEDSLAGRARGRPRSSLSPREIQARLRAGSTTSEVADAAQVDEEWVLRFAAPILAEQAQVVESAQRLTLVKARRGPSTEPLAPSVQWNLADKGVRFSDDVFSDSWSAYNLHGARWAVRFAYTWRKRRHIAEWEVDLRERSLAARNRLATELGHVEEGRRRPSAEPPDAAPRDPGLSSAGAAIVASRAVPASQPVSAARPAKAKAPPAGKPTIAKKAAPTKSPARRAAAKASPAKAPAAKAPAAKATGKAPAKAPAAKATGKAPAKAPAKASLAKASLAKAPAKAPPPAAKAARASTPRKARPAKKPPADTPGASRPNPSADRAPDERDRPSHLARPPSPMKSANRAVGFPEQGVTSTYARAAGR